MKCIMKTRTPQCGWYRQYAPQIAHYLAMILSFGCGSAAVHSFVAFPVLCKQLRPLSHIQAEENHRWTQINTDSEGWTQIMLRFALGHCPVKGFSSWKSMASSRSYLCLSVSICGCIDRKSVV